MIEFIVVGQGPRNVQHVQVVLGISRVERQFDLGRAEALAEKTSPSETGFK